MSVDNRNASPGLGCHVCSLFSLRTGRQKIPVVCLSREATQSSGAGNRFPRVQGTSALKHDLPSPARAAPGHLPPGGVRAAFSCIYWPFRFQPVNCQFTFPLFSVGLWSFSYSSARVLWLAWVLCFAGSVPCRYFLRLWRISSLLFSVF